MPSTSQHSRHSHSRWTKTALQWLSVCLVLSSASSCAALGFGRKQPTQPPKELCIIGDAGCLCFDPRMPPEQGSYTRPFPECVNYIATNPMDYDAQQAWIAAQCWGKGKL